MRYIQIILLTLTLTFTACQSDHKQIQKPHLLRDKSSIEKERNTQEIKAPLHQETSPKTTAVSKEDRIIALTTIKAEHEEKLAAIAAKKEKDLKEIELQKSKIEHQTKQKINQTEYESKIIIAKEKQKYIVEIEKEKTKVYQQYLIAGTLLILAFFLLFYLIHRRNQLLKLQLQEEELLHKAQMQENQHQHERINKTLEIIANENADKNLKKELIQLLKHQQKPSTKLLK